MFFYLLPFSHNMEPKSTFMAENVYFCFIDSHYSGQKNALTWRLTKDNQPDIEPNTNSYFIISFDILPFSHDMDAKFKNGLSLWIYEGKNKQVDNNLRPKANYWLRTHGDWARPQAETGLAREACRKVP